MIQQYDHFVDDIRCFRCILVDHIGVSRYTVGVSYVGTLALHMCTRPKYIGEVKLHAFCPIDMY